MTVVRTRRSSAEVRALMVKAASELFHRKGFDGTSTKEISAVAGVTESMLFRHFGSKQAIFEESVLKPFADFVDEFITDWVADRQRRPEDIAHSYISGFFELCRHNLELITTLRAAGSSDDEPRLLVHEQLDTLADQVARHRAVVGRTPGLDPQLAVRFTIALVVGAAQLGEDFFGIGDRLTTELAAFVVRGTGTDPSRLDPER